MQKNRSTFPLWDYWYMGSVTFVTCMLAYLCSYLNIEILLPALFIILLGVIYLWKKSMSKKVLYLLNMLNLFGAVMLGCILSFIVSKDLMIGIICGAVIMDVLSFTKYGKNTLNAKLSQQTYTLARLSICLPVVKKQGLQPIIGVGDLVFYSLLMTFAIKATLGSDWLGITLLILAGQGLNILLISMFIHKSWYKGFPATLFPGVFFICFYVFL